VRFCRIQSREHCRNKLTGYCNNESRLSNFPSGNVRVLPQCEFSSCFSFLCIRITSQLKVKGAYDCFISWIKTREDEKKRSGVMARGHYKVLVWPGLSLHVELNGTHTHTHLSCCLVSSAWLTHCYENSPASRQHASISERRPPRRLLPAALHRWSWAKRGECLPQTPPPLTGGGGGRTDVRKTMFSCKTHNTEGSSQWFSN